MGAAAGAMGKPNSSTTTQTAKEAMKRAQVAKKRGWMPRLSSKQLLLAAVCAVVAAAITIWSAPPTLSGASSKARRSPPGAAALETLSKQITVNSTAAAVFEYIRTPSTWFEWQRQADSIH